MPESTEGPPPPERELSPTAREVRPTGAPEQPRLAAVDRIVTAEPHKKHIDWERLASFIEVVTLPLVLIGGALALFEYIESRHRDRREVAAHAYDQADNVYKDYLKLCLEHPDLECYTGRTVDITSLDEKQQQQQQVMYIFLIDAFEVAYTNYNNEEYVHSSPRAYCAEWPGWVAVMRKAARRPNFVTTWRGGSGLNGGSEVHGGSGSGGNDVNGVNDEFYGRFQGCLNDIVNDQGGHTPAAIDAPPSVACRLENWTTLCP
jgi:hypothetical protein